MLTLLLLALGADPFPFSKAEAELSATINANELQAHVHRLAGPDFLGRRDEGAERAAEHIARLFASMKLQPAFGDSFFQPIVDPGTAGKGDSPKTIGRNVGAFIPGSDPKLADEWIILAAHFDHLGMRNGKVHPGADDNASGVAMLLEVAEAFALTSEKPKRSIYFISHDWEEFGLKGSNFFVRNPPRDLSKLKAFFVADILGRSMADVMDEYLFVFGSETSPRLRRLVQEIVPDEALKTGRLGADIIGTRSDYGPFRDRKIPFLFFSTGTHRDYHKPTDLPERINYEKLARISRYIAAVTRKLADDGDMPKWDPAAVPADLDEVKTFAMLLTRALERPLAVTMNDNQRKQVTEVRDKLAAILERQAITPDERAWLIRTAQWLLLTVFSN